MWAVQGTPCGRLLAAALPDLVPRLRRLGELEVDGATAGLLLRIAPATIDRRLKADRAKLDPRGRSHTKPGTLLKDSIPMRTWAEWDDARLGFVEIDLVGHEGGNCRGEFCFSLDITDIATGWTETRPVRNKAQKWVFAYESGTPLRASHSPSWESILITAASSSTGICSAGAKPRI